jgi:hypothetical protein
MELIIIGVGCLECVRVCTLGAQQALAAIIYVQKHQQGKIPVFKPLPGISFDRKKTQSLCTATHTENFNRLDDGVIEIWPLL